MISQSLYLNARATPHSSCCGPIAVAVIGRCFSNSRFLLKCISEDAGLHCAGLWRNGIDAIASLEENPPHVVLMDIDLPEVHGLVALPRIKVLLPGIRILAVTSSQDSKAILTAIKKGASGYVLKSATPAEVSHAVRIASNGGAAVDVMIAQKLIAIFHNLLRQQMNPPDLSRRERQVLQRICRSMDNKEIADEMDISVWTVRVHLKNIYRKLSVRSRTEAAMKFRDLISQPACLP